MGGMTGGTVPALIWRDVMKIAVQKYGNKDFEYPDVDIEFVKLPPSMTLDQLKDKELKLKEDEELKDGSEIDIDAELQKNMKNLHQQNLQQNFSEVMNNIHKAQPQQVDKPVVVQQAPIHPVKELGQSPIQSQIKTQVQIPQPKPETQPEPAIAPLPGM